MPVVYQIDGERRLIRTTCSGELTLPEVLEHFRTLQNDPNCPDHLDVFLDVRDVKTVPLPGQLSAVVSEIRRVRPRVRFGACAIVADRDVLYGMMRVFEAQADELFAVTRTFRTAQEAEAWLVAQRLPLTHQTGS
jgi:hypothetical protein